MAPKRKLLKRNSSFVPVRLALLGACMGWFSRTFVSKLLLPLGPARPLPRVPTFGPVDETNDLLMAKHGKLTKIYERIEPGGHSPLMKGTETLFFDDSGIMYATTEHGNLISFTAMQTGSDGKTTVKTNVIKHLGIGRPMTGKFLGNTLYVVDAVLGLTRVKNVFDPSSKVEIVVSKVVDENGKETRINYADDLAVAPKSGMVYFTDASEVHPQRRKDMTWDLMYASKVEALRGPTGRLLQYNPSTDEVKVLANNLYFANGVAVAEDESYLVFVETFFSRVTKFFLKGEKKGSMEYVIDGYPSPAWFDGIDCGWKRFGAKQSSLCYTIGVSTVVPVAKFTFMLPKALQILLRTVLMMLPPSLAPRVKPYASIVTVDAETLRQVSYVQDPRGSDVKTMTGITFYGNKLYLGSLHNNYIAVYDLA